MAVLAVLPLGVTVHLLLLRGQIAQLDEQTTQARAELSATSARVERAGARQVVTAERAMTASGALDRATALLAEAGIDRSALDATERDTSTVLDSLERERSGTEQRVDELAADLVEAEGCVDAAIRSVATAGSWDAVVSVELACQAS